MDDAHQIVLQALEQAGVVLPPGADSVQDLSPSSLVAISARALALIRGSPSPPLAAFPQSMSERFRICNELASSIKDLGYRGDLSFHQFLYPSEEETHKLLRFLLDNLSKSSIDGRGSRKGRGGKFANEGISASKTLATAREALSHWLEEANENINSGTTGVVGMENAGDLTVTSRLPFRTCPMRLASSNSAPGRKTPALITLQAKPKSCLIPSVLELNAKSALMSATLLDGQFTHLSREVQSLATGEMGDVRVMGKGSLQEADNTAYDGAKSNFLSRVAMFSKEKDMMLLRGRIMQGEGERNEQLQESTIKFSDAQADLRQREMSRLEERLSSVSIENTKLTREVADLDQSINKLEMELDVSSKELEVLKRNYSMLKAAAEMALDPSKTEGFKIHKLMTSIEESEQRLASLKIDWESLYKELESKKGFLESSALTTKEELQTKLKQVKETRQQTKDMANKLKQREEQLASLTMELENALKGPSRNTYIRRIMELIKNSKKQDTDISRIIGEMRELQRESNANQGRLKRTHALVDELVFRDAKKDPVGRQAYRLLTSIHENFSDCYDKVFSIDKVRREIAELQATLETLEKRPVDLKKVQADVDALVTENLALEKSLR